MPRINTSPEQLYLELMTVVRKRLDAVKFLASAPDANFAHAEIAAFHGRKVIEGIAFACLVASEHARDFVPRTARGQWNAERILTEFCSKGIIPFPSPSIIRHATEEERKLHNVKFTVEGVPEQRILIPELIAMYQRMHRWLHELNPYVSPARGEFYRKNGQQLWDDLAKIDRFIERHCIIIAGRGFFCVLRDRVDNETKVLPLEKIAEIPELQNWST